MGKGGGKCRGRREEVKMKRTTEKATGVRIVTICLKNELYNTCNSVYRCMDIYIFSELFSFG